MKKRINALIESENAILKINNFCYLHRWTHSPAEGRVDRLEVFFKLTICGQYHTEIKARDWRGVIEEVQEAQTKAFAEEAEKLNKELKNGYFG